VAVTIIAFEIEDCYKKRQQKSSENKGEEESKEEWLCKVLP